MVAFGWRLYSSRNPGWEEYYVDYAALKAQIKTIQRQEREGLHELAVNENALLLRMLTQQLGEASAFWDERCERYERELDGIKHRVTEMRDAAARGSPRAASSTDDSASELTPFRSVFLEEQKETALLKEYVLLRAQLERLQEFQQLNQEAVRKIVKKNTKQNPSFAGTIDMAALLDKQSFLLPAQTNHPASLLKSGVAVEQSLMDQFGQPKIVEMWMWLRLMDMERRVESLGSHQLSDRKKMKELGDMKQQGVGRTRHLVPLPLISAYKTNESSSVADRRAR